MRVYHGSTMVIERPIAAAYMANLMPLETALRELSRHQPNNQLCIASQKVIDECMRFVESYNI